MTWLIFLPAVFPAARLLLARLTPSRGIRRRVATTTALATFFAVLPLALAAGCTAAPTPAPTAVPPPARGGFNPPAEAGEVNPILATQTLEVGRQRVAFLLVGQKALIKAPRATVAATYLGQDGGKGPAERGEAVFHPWPYGIRGAYSTELTFDRPGLWRLDIAVEDGEFAAETSLELEVSEDSPPPSLGRRPPLSRSKTLADGVAVEQLTTDYTPDADLYRLTVADAIESPRPAVIVFASPAFCTSATCGPQVDTVSELKEKYRGRADFVHVEIYDRPQEIQGDLSRAELAPAVAEWGFTQLPHWFNESWVFILNDRGLVAQRFEGYAALGELEAELKGVLGEG